MKDCAMRPEEEVPEEKVAFWTDKAVQAAEMIANSIRELDDIVKAVSQDGDVEMGWSRFRRWKARTIKGLSKRISSDEAKMLEKASGFVRMDGPLANFEREIKANYRVLQTFLEDLPKHPEHYFPFPGDNAGTRENPNRRSVFVVHGRNESASRSMFSFLRSIELEPIEWAKAVALTGAASPYVGQILDAAFSHAQAVVVLFTPDDEGRLREEFRHESDPTHEAQLTPQARLNVIFEAGMAMGRFQNRTVLVELGDLRPFSDIAGRHVIRLDDSPAKRQEFAQRLQAAGCAIDITGTDWHTEGNFSIS